MFESLRHATHESFRIAIAARPEEVFAYVADLPRHAEWAADRIEIRALAAGPVGVGSRYHSRNRMGGRAIDEEIRVTAYEPPSRFCFAVSGGPVEAQHEFTVRPQNGGSVVERAWTRTATRPELALIQPLIYALAGRRAFIRAMCLLKDRLEG